MADPAKLIALAVVLAGVPLLGAGFVNGDAAAYCAQGWAGAWLERPTHAAWGAWAALVGTVAPHRLPWLLDLTALVASGVAILGAARLAEREGGSRTVAALGAAAAVLPWAPFAEVDPVWVAAVTWAAAGVAPAMGAAVVLSPTALLALPWVLAEHRDGRSAVGAWTLAGVMALVVGSGGAWLWGERGVLAGARIDPLAAAPGWTAELPWLLLPLVLACPGRAWPLALLGGLVLAPPDVPVWTLFGLAVAVVAARAVGESPPNWAWGLAALAVPVALSGAVARARAVRVDAETVHAAVARLGPDDGLVAPWSWGARVSVAATGRVYGLRWWARPPVRDQRARWCADPPARAWTIDGAGLRRAELPACPPDTAGP